MHKLGVVPMVNERLNPVFRHQYLVIEEELVPVLRQAFGPLIVRGALGAFQYFFQCSEAA